MSENIGFRNYDDIRETIKTGDIALFAGKTAASKIYQKLVNSSWSHVGMLIKPDDLGPVLLWESTMLDDIKDVNTQQNIQGVQTVIFTERLETYKGDIAVRHLKFDENILNPTVMQEKLDAYRSVKTGTKFEDRPVEIFIAHELAGMPFKLNEEDTSKVFCSELIAETYQKMGLLDESKPSNEYVPKDFSTETKVDLPLAGDTELKKEIMIKKYTPDGK